MTPVDPYGRALDDPTTPLWLVGADGGRARLPVERWSAPLDDVDREILRGCAGPTLDVGCGPGRIAGALAATGIAVLGIDVNPSAARHTARRGAGVLCRSVFDPLPGEGRWSHVLLLDGNIGIGGEPAILLDRCRDLVHSLGEIVVEVEPAEIDFRTAARLEDDAGTSAPFSWARVGARALQRAAAAVGLSITGERRTRGRVILSLRPVTTRLSPSCLEYDTIGA